MFRRVERQAKRLTEMRQTTRCRSGKLVKIGNGFAYAEAREKCLNCRSTHECLVWLDADPPSSEAPLFCPNFSVFEACKRHPGSKM